jgi:hypothetical protein
MAEQAKQPLKARISHKHKLEVEWDKATDFLPKAGELIIYDPEVDANGNTITMVVNGKTVPALPTDRSDPYTMSRVKVGDGYHYLKDLEFIGGSCDCCPSDKDMFVFYCGDGDELSSDPYACAEYIIASGTAERINIIVK